MFSQNLINRVAKFGGIENLLNSFICKQCSSVGKPQKVKRVSKPREKKVDVKVYDIPIYKGYVKKSIVLLDDPEICKEVTSSACYRPDLYLNADRTCDDCNLYTNCGCAIKKLSKKKSLIA